MYLTRNGSFKCHDYVWLSASWAFNKTQMSMREWCLCSQAVVQINSTRQAETGYQQSEQWGTLSTSSNNCNGKRASEGHSERAKSLPGWGQSSCSHLLECTCYRGCWNRNMTWLLNVFAGGEFICLTAEQLDIISDLMNPNWGSDFWDKQGKTVSCISQSRTEDAVEGSFSSGTKTHLDRGV